VNSRRQTAEQTAVQPLHTQLQSLNLSGNTAAKLYCYLSPQAVDFSLKIMYYIKLDKYVFGNRLYCLEMFPELLPKNYRKAKILINSGIFGMDFKI